MDPYKIFTVKKLKIPAAVTPTFRSGQPSLLIISKAATLASMITVFLTSDEYPLQL
jgi:hypothetical protein